MRKNLLKTMLATLLLAVGSTAWAGDKVVASYSFDNDASPTLTLGNRSGASYDYESVATGTKFLTLYDTNNNHNGDTYVNFTADTDLSAEAWTLDFYWACNSGSNNRPGYTYFYAGDTKLFTITDPGVNKTSKLALTYGESGSVELTVPIMNTSNRFKPSIATVLNKKNYWYHFVITGDPTNGVRMTVADCNGSPAVATDAVLSATNVAPTAISLRPAACGGLAIDELKLSYYTDEAVANVPAVELTKVDGIKRIYTATVGDGETLHYIVPGGTEQTSASAETEITVTADGDLQAWTTNGAATSEKVTVAVTTGEVSLATPAISIVSIGEGAEKSFNVTCDNSSVLLKPTATITYDFVPAEGGEAVTGAAVDGTIEADVAGTYTFTATAEGYTSSQLTFENKAMLLVTDVDVTALDPTTVSSNWTAYADARTVGSSSQWARYFTEALDGYWYNFASETAAADDILPGLTLEIDDSGKTPQLFNTLGLMYPVHVLNADGTEAASPALTTMKVGIAEPEGKIAIITYRPGYSNNNYSTVVLSGSQTWSMNRFDKAITSYKVYTEQKPLYLETDMTAQFNALTQVGNWTGATGYTATAYCPMVTTNTGQQIQVCESYVDNCSWTGDVFYQTVTGLTPGTYKIELYGGAAFTFNRGFGSDAFTGDNTYRGYWGDPNSGTDGDPHTAGYHIDENTGVTLYAKTSEGDFGGEIPIYYATNFPDGAATVVLSGVEVGENGEVTIGMSKTSMSTNWHVIQLKGVTAQVDAELLYAALVEKPMNAGVKAAMTAAITAARLDQSEENMAALSTAITAAQASAAAYEPLVENLEAIDDVVADCVEFGATDTSAYGEIAEAAANGTYEDSEIEDVLSSLRDIVIAIVKQQTKEGADFTPVINFTWVGQTGKYYFQGEDYAERYNGSVYTGDVMTQTVDGLPNGKYEIKLMAAASTTTSRDNITGAASGDNLTVLFANNSTVNIPVEEQLALSEFKTYTIEGIVTDGTLKYGMKNIAEGGNWFVIDALGITYLSTLTVSSDVAEALEELNAAIEHAIEVLADNVASLEAEDALLDVIDEADALYKKGKSGDQEVTPELIAEMIQRLQDAETAYLKDAETYDPTTAISSLNADGSRRSVYTIGGQKVDGKLQKGVYIVNGRKIVIK